MKYVKHYECTLCQKTFSKDLDIYTCDVCGEKGILDIIYDYEKLQTVITKDYFKQEKTKNILRYTPLMSIKKTNAPVLEVGNTPLYKSQNLAKELHLDTLYLKDEGLNPTASLKDRASLVACLKAIEKNHKTICCSSTGNAASSLAGNAAKLGLESLIFVPERAPLGKLTQLVMYGSNVVKVKGDYKAAFTASKMAIDTFGLYNRNASINPHLVEGKKTVIYEIMEQVEFTDLDYVIVSVGDGCTIGGIYKGLFDFKSLGLINKIPKIIGVQAEGCSPFYDAFISNSRIKEAEENTIADSIAVGIPRNPVKGLDAVQKSNGFYMTVSDQEIVDAILKLGEFEGIFAEPAAAASVAGLIKLVRQNKLKKQDRIAIIITGNGLKDTKSVSEMVERNTLLYNPELDAKFFKNKEVKHFVNSLKGKEKL